MSEDNIDHILAEARKKPMAERVAHANWKVRMAAYEEMHTALKGVYDEADKCLAEYAPLFSKAVAESNPAALTVAQEALNALLRVCNEQLAAKMCDRTCTALVSKCIGNRDDITKRSYEAMMNFIELEQAEKVMECLIQGFGNKVPKVVVAALEGVYQCINAFGVKVVAPQPVIKALPSMFEVKDAKARQKVKEIVCELARWMGPGPVKTLLVDKMRDAMKTELEAALQEFAGAQTKAQPTRLTRKEQAKPQRQPEAASSEAAAVALAPEAMEIDMPAEADPYDFSDPKAILPHIKGEFWEGLESKKWSDRKGSLTQLKELASTPRIAPGDYGDINRELRKVITKDNNVVVVAEAIGCCEKLAQGLRKEYAFTARNLVGTLFEKFKEKNVVVKNAVSSALTVMHKYCWSLQDVQEEVVAAMGHANPKVKEDALVWLGQEITLEPKAGLKPLVPLLLVPAAKCADEAAPTIREAAMTFMAAFAVKFGNPAVLEKFSGGMDETRKKKLQDLVAAATGQAAPTASAATTRASSIPPAAKPPSPRSAPAGPRFGLGQNSRPGTSSKPPASSATGTKPAAAKKAAGGDGDDEASLLSSTMSKDQALAGFTELVGEATIAQLGDEQWKIRLEAMDAVLAKVREPGVLDSSGSVLVQALSHLPGWGEKNFQVMNRQFDVLRMVADQAPTFSKRDALCCLSGVVDKVADMKLKDPSCKTLTCLAEAVGPQFVMAHLHKKAAAHKNPKVLSESINWMTSAISEFGLAGMDMKSLLDWMKEDLASTNAGVRTSAVQLIGKLHSFLGSAVGDLIVSDVKPALMIAINEEFAKNPQDTGFKPTRISRAAPPAGTAAGKASSKGGKASSGAGSVAPPTFDPDDLLPRTDISGSISPELITNLNSANWKERKAALDELEGLLVQAGNRIQPQTGELLPELKKRMADSNKNLTTQALKLMGKLAKAMGRAIDRNGRPVLTAAVRNISDQKSTVREAVTEMLDAWVSVASPEGPVTEVLEVYTSPKVTTDGKAESLKWLATLVAGGKLGDCGGDVLRAAGMGAQDKSGEVRDATTKLLTAMAEVLGTAELSQILGGMDGNSRKAAQEALAKATGTLIAAASASTTAPKASAVRSSTTSVRSSVGSLPKASAAPAAPAAKAGGVRSSTVLNRSMAAGPGGFAAAAADAGGALIVLDNKKDDRAKKGRFRPSKLQIAPDEASTLEAEFGPLLSPALRAAAFHKDFKKHCEAAEMITHAVPQMYDEVLSVVDLLFRWCTLRILESNTASLVKVLELLKVVLDAMAQNEYRMTEYEAKLLLPAVVEKAGHNQDKLKAEHRELLRRVAIVHPPVKVVSFIKDGLESKNSKTRVVCLDEIAAMVERHGPVLYRAGAVAAAPGSRPGTANASEPLMAAVAKLVTERDPAVRASCLAVVEVLLCIEGDNVWRYMGKLTDQQKSLVEERVKSAVNKMARSGLAPGYRAADFGIASVSEDVDMTPASGGNTPRRPASPLRRSGIGMGAPAAGSAAAGAAARPVGSVLDSMRTSPGPGLPGVPGGSRLPLAGSRELTPPGYSAPAAAPAAQSPLLRFSAAGLPGSSIASDGPTVTSLQGRTDAETQDNWVAVTHKLEGNDWEAAIEAMKVVCYAYMDGLGSSESPGSTDNSTLHKLLTHPRHVEELLTLVARKQEQAFTDAGDSTLGMPDGPTYNLRACKYAVNTIMSITNPPAVSNGLSANMLHTLFSTLVSCIIDDRVKLLTEGEGLLKAINIIIMKLLEHGPKPGVFGALIQLLREPNPRITMMSPIRPDQALGKWNEMMVKCLIKMTKALQQPAVMETLDVPAVLVHIHLYLQNLGESEARRLSAAEDKPLRMIKTLLHEVCKLRGERIYTDLRNMPGVVDTGETWVIMPYIRLNLDTAAAGAGRMNTAPSSAAVSRASSVGGAGNMLGAQQHVLAPITNAMPTSNGGAIASSPKVSVVPAAVPVSSSAPSAAAAGGGEAVAPVRRSEPLNLLPSSEEFTRCVTDEQEARNILAAIFKRIGDKAQTNQALVDLYHFMEANPNIGVLNQMLSQVSPFFKQYLTRGLSKVKTHMQASAQALHSPARPTAEPGKSGSSWGSPDGEAVVAAAPPLTVADKLAAGEGAGQGLGSPGRLRGAGNLDDLRSRMNNLSVELNVLPVRATASVADSQASLADLKERLKQLNGISAAPQ